MSAVDEARALLDHIDRTGDAQAVTDALALIVRLCDEVERWRGVADAHAEERAIAREIVATSEKLGAENRALREYHAAAEAYGPLAAQARRSAERALESWGGNDTAAYLSAEMTSREDREAADAAAERLAAARTALAAKGEG